MGRGYCIGILPRHRGLDNAFDRMYVRCNRILRCNTWRIRICKGKKEDAEEKEKRIRLKAFYWKGAEFIFSSFFIIRKQPKT